MNNLLLYNHEWSVDFKKQCECFGWTRINDRASIMSMSLFSLSGVFRGPPFLHLYLFHERQRPL